MTLGQLCDCMTRVLPVGTVLIKRQLRGLTRGVSHCGLAIYIKKYLNAEEELWKLRYFTMQKYNLQQIL